jgi:hypothetical protein
MQQDSHLKNEASFTALQACRLVAEACRENTIINLRGQTHTKRQRAFQLLINKERTRTNFFSKQHFY